MNFNKISGNGLSMVSGCQLLIWRKSAFCISMHVGFHYRGGLPFRRGVGPGLHCQKVVCFVVGLTYAKIQLNPFRPSATMHQRHIQTLTDNARNADLSQTVCR